MDFGEVGSLYSALGTGIWVGSFVFGIGYVALEFFSSIPDIDRSEQLRKNTGRIYELEKEVGLRDGSEER